MPNPVLSFALVLAFGVFVVGCGSSGGRDSDDGGAGSADFSCTNAAKNLCDEYTGVPVADLRTDCSEQNGTAGRGCTLKDASGVCTEIDDGEVLIRKVYYGLSSDEVASAKELCEANDRVWSSR